MKRDRPAMLNDLFGLNEIHPPRHIATSHVVVPAVRHLDDGMCHGTDSKRFQSSVPKSVIRSKIVAPELVDLWKF